MIRGKVWRLGYFIVLGAWCLSFVAFLVAVTSDSEAPNPDAWQKPAGYAAACNALDLFPDATPADIVNWLHDHRGIEPAQAVKAVAAGLDHDCAS